MGMVGDLRVASAAFEFLEDANKFEARRINVGAPSPDSPTAFHVLRSDSYLTLITHTTHSLSINTPLFTSRETLPRSTHD
jgi:hypothetical protein